MGAQPLQTLPYRRAKHPSAVLFDLDGVLWDSSAAHEWAFMSICRSEGLRPVRYELLAGRPTSQAWEMVLEANQREAEPADLARMTRAKQEMARQRLCLQPPLRPGALLVGAIAQAGLPVALVTGSSAPTVELFLRASGLNFDVVINAESVLEGKPSPGPYALAAAQLGVSPAGCWALEDSDQGLRAAAGAGVSASHLRPGPGPCPGGHVPVERCVAGIDEFVDIVLASR